MTTTTVHTKRTRVGWGFWLQWVGASTGGLTLAMLSLAVIDSVAGQENSLGDGLAHIVGLALAGAVVGIVQWLVLRRQIRRAAWGVLANSVALPVGFFGGYLLGGPPVDFFGGFVVLGILGGITYWLVLRQQVYRAGWWVLASSLGWVVGGGAAFVVAVTMGDAVGRSFANETLAFVAILSLLGVAGGLVGGAITGAAITRLLQHPLPGARE